MQVFAYHDRSGRITGLLAVNAPDGVSLMAQPKPGEFVSEIRPERLSGLSGRELLTRLREVMSSSEVAHEPRELRPRGESQ
jgi:hypothetical protein